MCRHIRRIQLHTPKLVNMEKSIFYANTFLLNNKGKQSSINMATVTKKLKLQKKIFNLGRPRGG